MRIKRMVMCLAASVLLFGLIGCSDNISKKPRKVQSRIIHDLDMEFIYVAPGSFQMGAEDGDKDENPVHQVTITKGYWIGKYEVTQKEYQSVMGTNPSEFQNSKKPVEMVSWNDAVRFCKELTACERAAGRLPANCEYRLPTEAEWEFAARGGTKSRGYKYCGSDSLDSAAWFDKNFGTNKVGNKSGNELGIHDMSGNVWEWCSDWYGKYSGTSETDSTGASSGSCRVIRGGGWSNSTRYCRYTNRFKFRKSYRYNTLGFRIIRTISVVNSN
jgi:formylglycine-generating enzyme required for sulfatase activity